MTSNAEDRVKEAYFSREQVLLDRGFPLLFIDENDFFELE